LVAHVTNLFTSAIPVFYPKSASIHGLLTHVIAKYRQSNVITPLLEAVLVSIDREQSLLRLFTNDVCPLRTISDESSPFTSRLDSTLASVSLA
jgi:hypothetical protein